ncbi:effector binding domain-containing protein [Bibersteinia trehalosi]|uniref:effector binding domain-containing protein n=1 Tax=Bibersteinia trehalosi TaxID=47735 RepID=UPI004045EAF4
MLTLYPIKTDTFTHNAIAADFVQIWQSVELPEKTTCYGVYFNYRDDQFDFAVATEIPNGNPPIVIEDLTWYEKFPTKCDWIGETWQGIWQKAQQGLLKRAFTVDFEKYLPEGRVDIYIAVRAQC